MHFKELFITMLKKSKIDFSALEELFGSLFYQGLMLGISGIDFVRLKRNE
jgi:hypothetical protein